MSVENFPAKFMEKVEDTRCIGDNRMNRRQAISPVDGAIFKDSRFLNIDDGIDAEAADALSSQKLAASYSAWRTSEFSQLRSGCSAAKVCR